MAGFIASQRDDHDIPQATACRALGVSQAWFYKWRHGDRSPRHARRARLAVELHRLFAARNGRDGSPRITAALHDAGWRVSKNTVAQIMAEEHLIARPNHAVHRMFERACAAAGSTATLHASRHTAAFRMAEDPQLPLTDVQYVLGHAQLSTTQLYLNPHKDEVIRRVLAHHAAETERAAVRTAPPPTPGYRPDTLAVLFGGTTK